MGKKERGPKMDDFSDLFVNTSEFIRGRLYFVTLNTSEDPKSTPSVHYFTVDTEQCYDGFYDDFGPLNLAILYHFCHKLDKKLASTFLINKKIVFYSGTNERNRVNAAFLIGAYAVIKLSYEPERAYKVLARDSKQDYLDFRDASIGYPYTLSLLNCLKAVKRAMDCGFFNFAHFDYYEYEYYERVENGDLNWIVPEKFLAFCGPHHKATIEKGYPMHCPETYFNYFHRHNVSTIIRLNNKAYDAGRFVEGGFQHKDLFFVDGGIPDDKILANFLTICENAPGAIAVHCKAGLGRTGTLIAAYIMKHYKFTAHEAIGWIRICRPGSIIAHQQTWLIQKQKQLWAAGEEYRTKHKVSFIKHPTGVYGEVTVNNNPVTNNNSTARKRATVNVTGIMRRVNSMELNDNDNFESEEDGITQGDRLNEIKAQRGKSKQHLATNISERRTLRTKVVVNAVSTSPLKVRRVTAVNTGSTTSSSKVTTKRNKTTEGGGTVVTTLLTTATTITDGPVTRRQRKVNASTTSISANRTTTTTTRVNSTTPTLLTIKRKQESNINWLLNRSKCNNVNNVNNNNIYSNNSQRGEQDPRIDGIIKRAKRSLILEKDKAGPHSIKLLRRSVASNSRAKRSDGKIRLPSVKLKSI